MADPYGFKPEFYPGASGLYPSLENNFPNVPTPHLPTGLAPPTYNFHPPHITSRYGGYYWVNTNTRAGVPTTAVQGGVDSDGTSIYVGRAYHEGDWVPAKVIPEKQIAYIAYNGQEHPKHEFEVLCEQRFDWVPASDGHIPADAVVGGATSDGETLYVGRAYHEGSQTVGKVHPSHRCCYIPYGGEELSFPQYEILVLRH